MSRWNWTTLHAAGLRKEATIPRWVHGQWRELSRNISSARWPCTHLGIVADFRNIVIVMTTNAGAQEMSRASIGFTQQDHSSDAMAIIKKSFSPEFRNRIDAIIQFASLDARSVARVVDKLVVELEAKLGSNNVTLELDDAARNWIAERGYDPKMGARPMARIIQEYIKRPLAEELLFGSLADGGHVRIGVGADGKLELNPEPVRKELAHLPKE